MQTNGGHLQIENQLLYLSIGVEECTHVNSKNTVIMTDTLITLKIGNFREDALIRPQNMTFDRHVFLITKHFQRETVGPSTENLAN